MTEVWSGSVGERLLKLRNEKGMTQEDLAEYLNVSRQSVSKWELNKTLPDVEKILQLSELYEVTLDYIIKGEEEMEEEDVALATDEGEGTQDISGMEDWKNAISIQSPFELTVHRIVFLVAMFFSGVIFVCTLIFTVHLISNHAFSAEGKEQGVVYVDQVYDQYTLADVQVMDENENWVNKKIWLDINGVREGDYIGYYYEADDVTNIHFMYYAKSLIVPFIIVVLSLIFTIIGWMGFRSYGGKRK